MIEGERVTERVTERETSEQKAECDIQKRGKRRKLDLKAKQLAVGSGEIYLGAYLSSNKLINNCTLLYLNLLLSGLFKTIPHLDFIVFPLVSTVSHTGKHR